MNNERNSFFFVFKHGLGNGGEHTIFLIYPKVATQLGLILSGHELLASSASVFNLDKRTSPQFQPPLQTFLFTSWWLEMGM